MYLLLEVVSRVYRSVGRRGSGGRCSDQLTSSQQVHRLPDTGWSLYAPALFGERRRVRSLSARSFKILHVYDKAGGCEARKYTYEHQQC